MPPGINIRKIDIVPPGINIRKIDIVPPGINIRKIDIAPPEINIRKINSASRYSRLCDHVKNRVIVCAALNFVYMAHLRIICVLKIIGARNVCLRGKIQ